MAQTKVDVDFKKVAEQRRKQMKKRYKKANIQSIDGCRRFIEEEIEAALELMDLYYTDRLIGFAMDIAPRVMESCLCDMEILVYE